MSHLFLKLTLLLFTFALPFTTTNAEERYASARHEASTLNGIDLKFLREVFERLKKDPNAGKITFFSDTKWATGMKSATNLSGYILDGKVNRTKERLYTIKTDSIKEIGGTDTAPAPIEELMSAIGACIAASANLKAAMMGVTLTGLDVALESDLDLRGVLGVNSKIRPGILNFRTKITISGDADEDVLKKIAQAGFEYSPASDTVRNGLLRSELPKVIVVR